METSVSSCAVLLVIASIFIAHVAATPTNQDGTFPAEKRPKYLDTRDLDGDIYDLVYNSIIKLVGDGRLNAAVLADAEVVEKGMTSTVSKRWYQGICHKRNSNGKLVAYFCSKQKRGYQGLCYRSVGGKVVPFFCNRSR